MGGRQVQGCRQGSHEHGGGEEDDRRAGRPVRRSGVSGRGWLWGRTTSEEGGGRRAGTCRPRPRITDRATTAGSSESCSVHALLGCTGVQVYHGTAIVCRSTVQLQPRAVHSTLYRTVK